MTPGNDYSLSESRLAIEVGPFGLTEASKETLTNDMIVPLITDSHPLAAVAVAEFFVRAAVIALSSHLMSCVNEGMEDGAAERFNPRALLELFGNGAPGSEGLADVIKEGREIAKLEEIFSLDLTDDGRAERSEGMTAQDAEAEAAAYNRQREAEAEYEATRIDPDADESTRDGSTSWDGDDNEGDDA